MIPIERVAAQVGLQMLCHPGSEHQFHVRQRSGLFQSV